MSGFKGHHGWIFGKNMLPVIYDEVMGVQGCKTGYLFGWIKSGESFVVKTHENEVLWLTAEEQFKYIKSVGCPENNIDNDINLAGFEAGDIFISL